MTHHRDTTPPSAPPQATITTDRRGMSLVEVMIVLLVVAAFVTVVGVVAVNAMDRAHVKDTNLRLLNVSHKIQEYHAKNPASMPTSLGALVKPPGGEPSYLLPEELHDAWNQAIRYEPMEGGRFALRSPGPDGDADTPDDIVLEDGG